MAPLLSMNVRKKSLFLAAKTPAPREDTFDASDQAPFEGG